MTDKDESFMRLALALSRRQLGLTAPNPAVGAVIVSPEGVILAQGVTQPGGRPHAERIALAALGESARGTTLYVNLEPCAHYGATSPCADAVIEAGIARVVTAISDPDPRVAGQGHERLRQAGIEVATDVMPGEALRVHRGHLTRVKSGRPAIILKLAQTRDGYAGLKDRNLTITGPEAQARVHLMRAHADTIMVGIGTVLSDDPQLDVRLPGLAERSPARVILDTHLRLPLSSQVMRGAGQRKTWIVAGSDASPEKARSMEAMGAEILYIPFEGGRIDLKEMLLHLGKAGVTRLFCEGGPTLAENLARDNLLDEIVIVSSPRSLEDLTQAPFGLGASVDPRRSQGLKATGPCLQGDLQRFRFVGDEIAGKDRLDFYEREL